jgi:alanine dehydrogenase
MTTEGTTGPAIWLGENDIARLVSVADAVAAVERGLRAEASGGAHAMDKTYVAVQPGITLQALGAAGREFGLLGTKTWPQGLPLGSPVLVAFDAGTGSLRAVMAASLLSRLRTGALGGVAAKMLAREGVIDVAVIGSGRQADTQVAAVAAVRPVRRLSVYSPTPANREAFARRMADQLGIEVVACASAEAAVKDVDVVITIAKSARPVLRGVWLKPGVHVNAVGVTIRGKRELDDVVERATVIAADSVSGARLLSDDLLDVLGDSGSAWAGVRRLCDLVVAGEGRPRDAGVTLYKGVGSGIADVALASAIIERAQTAGIGQTLADQPEGSLRLR